VLIVNDEGSVDEVLVGLVVEVITDFDVDANFESA